MIEQKKQHTHTHTVHEKNEREKPISIQMEDEIRTFWKMNQRTDWEVQRKSKWKYWKKPKKVSEKKLCEKLINSSLSFWTIASLIYIAFAMRTELSTLSSRQAENEESQESGDDNYCKWK